MTKGKVIWAQYDILRGQVSRWRKSPSSFPGSAVTSMWWMSLPGEDDCLILAITVVIDMMVSNGR